MDINKLFLFFLIFNFYADVKETTWYIDQNFLKEPTIWFPVIDFNLINRSLNELFQQIFNNFFNFKKKLMSINDLKKDFSQSLINFILRYSYRDVTDYEKNIINDYVDTIFQVIDNFYVTHKNLALDEWLKISQQCMEEIFMSQTIKELQKKILFQFQKINYSSYLQKISESKDLPITVFYQGKIKNFLADIYVNSDNIVIRWNDTKKLTIKLPSNSPINVYESDSIMFVIEQALNGMTYILRCFSSQLKK